MSKVIRGTANKVRAGPFGVCPLMMRRGARTETPIKAYSSTSFGARAGTGGDVWALESLPTDAEAEEEEGGTESFGPCRVCPLTMRRMCRSMSVTSVVCKSSGRQKRTDKVAGVREGRPTHGL